MSPSQAPRAGQAFKQVVPARKCHVESITVEAASSFVETHHSQGMARLGKRAVAYALYFHSDILGVIIFCNPRTSGMQKKYTSELFRLTFIKGVFVQGGASKLIKHYIKNNNPVSLFTYQVAESKASLVYAHAGMTLTSPLWPKKSIVVRNGIIASLAKNNRRDWFSMEQVTRHGPDALLGTTLGERFTASGARKSNINLFLEDCGYHIEKVAGDRIYQWLNPDVNFYLYRITSKLDKGYYIGRKTVWHTPAILDSYLNDGYWGSGGEKFKNWIKKNDPKNLEKEIISMHDSWESIVKAEALAVGDSYKNDPNCKNTIAGGLGQAASFPTPVLLPCEMHGLSLHRGNSCFKCVRIKSSSEKNCSVHGLTYYLGPTCLKCSNSDSIKLDECPLHGLVKFQASKCLTCRAGVRPFIQKNCAIHGKVTHAGDTCLVCTANERFITSLCSIHGETKFAEDKCQKCVFDSRRTAGLCSIHGVVSLLDEECLKCRVKDVFSVSECSLHGVGVFRGSQCARCIAGKTFNIKMCSIHGQTQFRGESCDKCAAEKAHSLKECAVHGQVIHRGDTCSTCTSLSGVSIQECPIHGEVKFMGAKCRVCLNKSVTTLKTCPIHGEAKHQGEHCLTCLASNRFSEKNCQEHGLTQHQGESCVKCYNSKSLSTKFCFIHGESIFRGMACQKCVSHKSLIEKKCKIHGQTKFKGNSCCQCTAEKAAHTRFHKIKQNPTCSLCIEIK